MNKPTTPTTRRHRRRRNSFDRHDFARLLTLSVYFGFLHYSCDRLMADGAWHAGPGEPTAAPAALDGQVRTMLSDGGTRCWVGGGFMSPANAITYWDGTAYQSAGAPFWLEPAQANAMIRYQGKLHVAGRFPAFGSEAILVRLDGEESGQPHWTPLISTERDGTNEGLALAVHDDQLWIGGEFQLQDGTRHIATWNGSFVGNAGDADGPVRALASHEGSLYAGGDFTNLGSACPSGLPGCPLDEQHLAVWNGDWSEAFGGADAPVYALHGVASGDPMAGLYIGGDFFTIGASSGHGGIARATFEGGSTSIDAMDGGVEGRIRTIQRWHQGVAAGGAFLTAGQSTPVTAFNVANWTDSGTWEAMDLGLEATVIDAPYGAAVLALDAYATVDAAGLHAGGNLAAYGSSMEHCNFAAKFFDLTTIETLTPFVADLENGAWNRIDEFSYALTPTSPASPASLTWGVRHADFQRLAWAPDSLEATERLDLRPLDPAMPHLAIHRPQGSGPFLPPPVLEISPSMQGEPSVIRIDCVTTAGETIESPLVVLEDAIRIDVSSLMTSVSIHDVDHGAAVQNIGIRVGNPADTLVATHVAGQELFQASDVARFSISIVDQQPFPEDTNGRFQLQLTGDLVVDLAESGFGVGRELHRLGPDLAPETFEVLESSAMESATTIYHCEDAGRSFRIEGTLESNETPVAERLYSRRSMTIAAAQEGDPFGVVIEDRKEGRVDPDNTLEIQSFEDRLQAHYQFDHPDLRGKVTFMGWDGEVEIPDDLEFEVIVAGGFPDGLEITEDDESDTTIIDWTEPGLVVFGGDHPLPPIEGPTGMVIGKVEGADGDDTWDVLQRSFMQVTSTMPSSVMVGATSFTVIEGEPEGDPADLNGDGVVNGADLALVLAGWGPCGDCPADITGDGVVDGADLALVLAAWDGGQQRREARRSR